MFSKNYWNVALKFVINSRNMTNKFYKSNFNIYKVMKSTFKTRISQYLLNNTFIGMFWRPRLDFFIWVPNITIEDTMKRTPI
jgi:hypothetical protein